MKLNENPKVERVKKVVESIEKILGEADVHYALLIGIPETDITLSFTNISIKEDLNCLKTIIDEIIEYNENNKGGAN